MTEQLSQQRMESLLKANTIRFARADDKKAIKAGTLNPAELLRHPPDHWKKTPVQELLTAMHRVGKSRARKWLWSERIDPSAELGRMPEIQRYRVAKHVEAAMSRRAVAEQ